MPAISRPLLILLAATFALLVLWLVALRPKPVAVENTPLAPTSEIPKAEQAAAESDAAAARAQGATAGGAPAPAPGGVSTAPPAGATAGAAPGAAPGAPAGTAPGTAAGTAPGAAAVTVPGAAAATTPAAPKRSASRPAPHRHAAAVARDVRRGKVVVLLFWNPEVADDVAARGVLRDLDRRGGKVLVRVVPISRAERYASLTGNAKIAQSPTTVIVARRGAPSVLAGLVSQRRIARAVGAALQG